MLFRSKLSTAVAIALTFGVLAIAISGCHKSVKGKKFAFVTNNASDFWKKAQAGVNKFHDETGIQVDFKQPSSASVTEQNNILDDLLTQGYDGIAVSVISPDEQTREIDKAAEQSTIISVDSDCPKSKRLVYIGTDNYEAGKVLGSQIVKLLPNGGKMAVFVGFLSADNARQRLKGIKDAIAGHNIDVVAEKEDQKDPTKARTNPEDVINNSALKVNLLCGLWSYNGGAIAAAIEASGNKGKILEACFDDDDDTLKGIENGTISCTVAQKPFEFGYQSMKLLNDIATNGKSAVPSNDKIDLGVNVVNSDNVKEYRANLASMVKK